MTFRFSVSDFMGARRADFDVSGITLLVGDGGASKSSLLRAIGAVTTGETIPVKGIKKSEALRLVRSGAEKGRVEWAGEGFKQTASYPKAEVTLDKGGEATPPAVSLYAAGLVDLLDKPLKDRAAVLYPLLKAEPTHVDLLNEMRDLSASEVAALLNPQECDQLPSEKEAEVMTGLKLNPERGEDQRLYRLLTKTWKAIKDKGWNTVYADHASAATDAKRDWKKVTQQTWGAVAGETWLPEGYDDSLHTHSLADLEAAARAAQTKLEAAIKAEGAGEAVLADLQAKAALIGPRTKEHADAAAESTKQEKAWQEFSTRSNPMVPTEPIPCPHCNQGVSIVQDLTGHRLEKSDKVTAEAIAAAKEARAKYDADRKAQSDKTDAAIKAERAALAALQEAKNAEAKLAELAATAGSDVSVADARTAKAAADALLAAYRAAAESSALHRVIVANIAIAAILSEDKGLRKRKLSQALDAFNKAMLSPLVEAANAGLPAQASRSAIWQPVTMSEDFEAEYGGRGFPMLCKSEQQRCRFVFQIAIAKLDDSALVLIDDAETIPMESRPGLLKMLKTVGIKAVVAMMLAKPDMAPDLVAAKLGATYWIEDGECMTRAEAITSKAA